MKREGAGEPSPCCFEGEQYKPAPLAQVQPTHLESGQKTPGVRIPLRVKIPTAFRPQYPGSIGFSKLGGAKRMRLLFKHSDDFRSNCLLVLDEDTGKEVGTIRLGGAGADSSGGIDIWLFDGKYQTRVKRYDTAVGFVLGVESVLNHLEDLQFQFASQAA